MCGPRTIGAQGIYWRRRHDVQPEGGDQDRRTACRWRDEPDSVLRLRGKAASTRSAPPARTVGSAQCTIATTEGSTTHANSDPHFIIYLLLLQNNIVVERKRYAGHDTFSYRFLIACQSGRNPLFKHTHDPHRETDRCLCKQIPK